MRIVSDVVIAFLLSCRKYTCIISYSVCNVNTEVGVFNHVEQVERVDFLAQRRVAAPRIEPPAALAPLGGYSCRWFAILANQAERKREPRGAERRAA